MLKKVGLAALLLAPFAAGCYAETYPAGYYSYQHPYHHHYYSRVYVAPAPPPRAVYVAPPPPARIYW